MSSDNRKAIYAEDGSFYRYRDGTMWGRFQTAATLEGGLLYGIYGAIQANIYEKATFAIIVSMIILIICRFAWKDVVDARAHLQRMKEFEGPIASYTPPHWRGPHGAGLLLMAMWILNLANIGLITRCLWQIISLRPL